MTLLATTLLLALAISVLYSGIKKYVAFRQVLASINHFPGIRAVFSDTSILAFTVRSIPGIVQCRDFPFRYKYELYKKFGVDMFAFVSALPQARLTVYVADPTAIKEVALARTRYPKPIQYYGALAFYGKNLVVSEHEEWKRFRKICAPSFTERNNKLVWDETLRVVNELFDDVWGAKDEVQVEDATDITRSITLFVISIAGFGQRISWKSAGLKLPGFEMTYKEAFEHMSSGAVIKASMPDWLLRLDLTKRLRDIRVASEELKGYMQNMIDTRRNSDMKEDRHDLLSNLLEASENEADGEAKLSDSELMGNIFIFLLAGHETTAHTLGFALALLALHQDEQQRLYEQTKSLLSGSELPKYSEINAYTYANAFLYETLRMFPPVILIPKYAAEDSTLTSLDSAGRPIKLNLFKGTHVTFDTTASHHNPRYWDDPHVFRPSRFLEDWPRDAFVPFSSGPRACIGRRFAEVEAVAVLVMFVSRYKLDVKPDPRFAFESHEMRCQRVLSIVPGGLTTTPRQVPLVFTRRE